tara:strand:+ start:269 stop:421 length:153 start_codon:yes stop_codon:yes gene_type:complete
LRDKGLIGDDKKKQMYLAQYDFIQKEVEKLEKHEKWLNTNLKDAGKYILV